MKGTPWDWNFSRNSEQSQVEAPHVTRSDFSTVFRAVVKQG